MATRIPAAATRAGHRPSAKICQLGNLPEYGGPLWFQIGA
jgi:hypothetical protein